MNDIGRVLGYLSEHGIAYAIPLWLCPTETWATAQKDGLIEVAGKKSFIAREGSYFTGWRITANGHSELMRQLAALQSSKPEG